jgi:NADH-quinone oxidoreductase subunit L
MGEKGAARRQMLISFALFFCSLYMFYEVCIKRVPTAIELAYWIKIADIEICWSFFFDSLSCTMILVIITIYLCVVVYSMEYMCYDSTKIRFFSSLALFTCAMINLVVAGNIIQLILGWELVGISSYMLIGYWYSRKSANKAALCAIFINKIGDVLLYLAAITLLIFYFNIDMYMWAIIGDNFTGDLQFESDFKKVANEYTLLHWWNGNVCIDFDKKDIYTTSFLSLHDYLIKLRSVHAHDIACFFLVLAAMCKSAQVGVHIWLTEAMEGPTPVSALLHAATMVTAGIYLTLRCSWILVSSEFNTHLYILVIGSITSFFCAFLGFYQTDLKKIVAYSTCSQLGYMFLSVGALSYNVSMYHLFNHAFLKALLFLSCGYIIHFYSGEQNIRRMGGGITSLPFLYICMLIGSLSLIGMPYFSGFFSKDYIIDGIISISKIDLSSIQLLSVCKALVSLSTFFTIAYSIKIIFYIYFFEYNGSIAQLKNTRYASNFVIWPLFFLSLLSIFSGYLSFDLMLGQGTVYWNQSLAQSIFSNRLPFEFNALLVLNTFCNTIYIVGVVVFIMIFRQDLACGFSICSDLWMSWLKKNLDGKFFFINRLISNSFQYKIFEFSYKDLYNALDKLVLEVLVGPTGIIRQILEIEEFNAKKYDQGKKLKSNYIWLCSALFIGLLLCSI